MESLRSIAEHPTRKHELINQKIDPAPLKKHNSGSWMRKWDHRHQSSLQSADFHPDNRHPVL